MVDFNSSLPDLSHIDGLSSSPTATGAAATASKPYADLSTIGQDTTQFSGSASAKVHEVTDKASGSFRRFMESAKAKLARQSEE